MGDFWILMLVWSVGVWSLSVCRGGGGCGVLPWCSRQVGKEMVLGLTLVSQRWVGKYGVCFFIGNGLK